jgi:hypothetical protein
MPHLRIQALLVLKLSCAADHQGQKYRSGVVRLEQPA